jgi:hypothetical protein
MHFWFWFFSLLAALVAWRQECVSTLQAVCKRRKNIKRLILTVGGWQIGSPYLDEQFLIQVKCLQIRFHALKLSKFSFYKGTAKIRKEDFVMDANSIWSALMYIFGNVIYDFFKVTVSSSVYVK